MAVKNMQASVLARLKQQAKAEGLPFQTVLQLFCQEEFLRRLAKSRYVDNMILKGGMFIYTLTEFASRPTKDIDFMIQRLSNELGQIQQTMEEICNIETGNDFISIEVLGTEQIAVEKKYPGVKTKFRSHIGNVRVPFSIDIGIDDVIIPEPVKRKIATRLSDFEQPEIYTYSLESTIAEKLDAILQRMEATSRMKDFYDLYYLSGIFDFDGLTLLKAVESTLKHRQRELKETVFDEIRDFADSNFLLTQWQAFEPAKESKLAFQDVLDRLEIFLRPIYESILLHKDFKAKWESKAKKWMF